MNRSLKRKRSQSAPDLDKQAERAEQRNSEYGSLVQNMAQNDKELARKSGKKLKLALSGQSEIGKFVNPINIEDLVAIMFKQTSLLGTEEYNGELHQYSISILANCCYTVGSTGFILKKNIHFLDQAVRIIESTTATVELKTSIIRLLGNLSSDMELAHWICSKTILFDGIALILENPDLRIVRQCLRLFTNLGEKRFTRIIMMANSGQYLGKLLAKPELRDEVVKVLRILFKRHLSTLDRQLCMGECSEHIINMFFGDKNKKNRQFVIELFSGTTCVREQMETEEFLEKLLTCKIPEKYRMLASVAQTAWGRAKMRTAGAIDVLVDKQATSSNLTERLAIVTSFKHFVHDTAGMRHLSENKLFLETIVCDLNNYVQKNRNECQPQVDLPLVMDLKSRRDKINDKESTSNQRNQDMSESLHLDYFSMWSYDTPRTSPVRMSPAYSTTPSPTYSIPSSINSSGASSPNIRGNGGILDELSDVESDHETSKNENEEEEKEKEILRKEKEIVESELWLLTYIAQDDYNLEFLVKPEIVDCVIAYLRCTSSPDFRTYRILRRMATVRKQVYNLLDLQFHVRVLTGLCASPCRMLKYSESCKKCDTCSEHGREILRVFASHVDNSYGDAHINSEFNNQNFLLRCKAAIAKIVLVKEQIRLAKVPALNELFEGLSFIMSSPEKFEEIGKIQTYPNGPSLVSQIIGALSILISGQRIRELCQNDSWYFGYEEDLERCMVANRDNNDELLYFVDENDRAIVTASMKLICEKSEYFETMFMSNFVENHNNVRTFVVEATKPEHFETFIHMLLGCQSCCANITSAEQCAALLSLSDQYLCGEISKQLCAENGPLRCMLNGETLHILLPVALTTNAHPTLLDTVFLGLIRFSPHESVTKALEVLCRNTTMVNTFVTSLRTFLTTKC